MKKGFTLVEVSILFVIFLIVAFLVAPLSLDDTIQAKNISKWKNVQQDFSNIYYSIETLIENNDISFREALIQVLKDETKANESTYKITYKNGTYPTSMYRFNEFKSTYSNGVFALKLIDKPIDNLYGYLMYDVNGKKGPNAWGKDVFGLNIYDNRIEPFGKTIL